MKCTNCGQEVREGLKFCTACGNKIETTKNDNKKALSKYLKIFIPILALKELDKTVLNELIDKIEAHEAEKIDGKRVQKVDIYYRFVGNLN